MIRIPVTYQATVVPRGARNPRVENFGEWVTADLQEVSAEDAPIAIRWELEEPRDSLERVEIRSHLGRFLKRSTAPGETSGSVLPLSAGHLAQATESGESWSPIVVGREWVTRIFTREEAQQQDQLIKPLNPEDFRSILSADRETMLERLKRRLDDLVVIDDYVWEVTPEPVLTATRIPRHRVCLDIAEHSDRRRANPDQHDLFRIDRYEDALAHAEGMLRGNETIRSNIRSLEVLLPDTLGFEDEGVALLAAARNHLNRTSGALKDFPVDMLVAWGLLRDSVSVYSGEQAEDLDKLANHVRHYLSVSEEVSGIADRPTLKAALERWDARPIEAAALAL